MTPFPWTERTFRFDFPVGLFPAILERVRGTPARLEELIAASPARIRTIKINAGWSILEHAGHLLDLEDLHVGRLDDFRFRVPVLRAADMSNKKTFDANHNATPAEELLASFRTSRQHFVQRLEQLDDDSLTASSLHPRLHVQMRLVDMVYFVAEHDDHHLAAIRRIAASLRL